MVNILEFLGIPGIIWDFIAMIITFFATIFVIIMVGIFYRKEKISDDMLLITNHVFAAPIAVCTWLLYSNEIQSRYLAAITPAIFTIIFIAILAGIMKNERFIRMLTTSEDLTVLRAPLIYSFIIMVLTIVGWPVPLDATGVPIYTSFIPTMMLVLGPWTGGWGMGHFVNRRYGKRKLPVHEDRSLEGGIAMFIFGIITSYLLIGFYWVMFYWQYPTAITITELNLMIVILVVSALAAMIELLSPSIYDNVFIPLGIIIVLLFLEMAGFYSYPIVNV
ncbi:hypothetical protein EU528_08690 [Candidatus Thorarchaeota archaeon]|nr:MAG: hypothetical protein EU528_08690 [Candidatus Thorarchaeota archaeon]